MNQAPEGSNGGPSPQTIPVHFSPDTIQSIFVDAPVGMALIDDDRRIVEANPALVDILHRHREDVIGQVAGEGLGCAHSREAGCGQGTKCRECVLRQAVVRAVNEDRVSRAVTFETPIEGLDGVMGKTFQIHVSPVKAKNEMGARVLVMFRDMSELRRRNDELERLVRAKDTLLRVVTHDLGSPMAGAFNTLETLVEDLGAMPADMARELLVTTRDSLKRQIDLLRRLLDYARLQTSQREIEVVHVNVLDALEAAVEVLTPAARSQKIALEVRTEETAPLIVLADAELLQRILINLLGNAIKFTPEGGSVTLGARLVDVEEPFPGEAPDARAVRIEVADTGVGMDEEKARRLADTGVAESSLGVRGESGTGLGLPFVVAALEAHRARLGVESAPGRGSRFHFDLLLAPLD